MSVLRLQNDFSYFTTDNEEVLHILWDKLRFRAKDYFHSRLYKQKLWDGYIDFFKKPIGKFLTGLLPEVQLALQVLKVPYTIQDNRDVVKWRHQDIDDQFLNQYLPKRKTWPNGEPIKPITLHDYQVDFINQAIRHHRGIIFSPTSSGKTFMLVGSLLALPENTPTLVLVNARGLADQNYEAIEPWLPNVGRLYEKYNDPNVITVATIQSIHKIEKLLPKIKALVVDEIHDMMSPRCLKCYKKLKAACVRLGFSATPFKFGGSDKVQKYSVKGFFGPVLKTKVKDAEGGVLKTKTLQEREILSTSDCTFYPINEPPLPYAIYQDAVTDGIAQNWHFHDVVCRLVQKLTGRTLILVDRLAHGDTLNNLIPNSLWVQGKDDSETRRYVIRQLQRAKGNVVAIATQQIFSAGINVFIHNLVNAAGGKADHLIVQRMGRGLRTANDKEILNYYDFVFTINDYLQDHSRKRIKILVNEGHKVTVKEAIDF